MYWTTKPINNSGTSEITNKKAICVYQPRAGRCLPADLFVFNIVSVCMWGQKTVSVLYDAYTPVQESTLRQRLKQINCASNKRKLNLFYFKNEVDGYTECYREFIAENYSVQQFCSQ